ncbi:hypothetical protein J3R80_05940 [Aliiroseovarius sp. Z3]|uniref:DUF6547 family protein n=1 Tax=Aliiroseovarius sp. Z3 TaxID=2811402 RepID=UPI0023B22BCE|nr:DUF6547 family protein [Aliiroseovarius sp. Z3]MDE9450007.1 hypothetical protein [Aliiroseovarius sp. Z3]
MAKHTGYKWLIEQFVEIARNSVQANRIRKNGHPVRTNDGPQFPLSAQERDQKEVLLSLDASAREVIARLIEQARISAVHDLACFLEAEISEKNVSIQVGDDELTTSPFASYEFDFVCRLEGDSWPDD